ncbi:conserved hypothetical protein [Deferribacter desulfuricans SSM1]|uniref:DUF1844 domain-containing protein n=1 Tax=Deferribacter desulfuricans (strain DSM 14783 / JCM 11476 / NBRC 101012 / SSM1) TaxID=639282 RepID=D3P9Q2_DEFDS|nr:DUF1844 domain-containing protein [Deferribacter desulfuricans]BAI81442.1 conserved hypothetical protein [Deferribacter desulfuricans SSM1]
MDEKSYFETLFFSLVTTFETNALIAMGKISNPVTGKLEKDLDAAKMNIDILRMIKDRTKNNLSEKEEKHLTAAITNLELNYVEELKLNGKS